MSTPEQPPFKCSKDHLGCRRTALLKRLGEMKLFGLAAELADRPHTQTPKDVERAERLKEFHAGGYVSATTCDFFDSCTQVAAEISSKLPRPAGTMGLGMTALNNLPGVPGGGQA